MIRVILQQQHRLLRDGLAELLGSRDGIEVVGTATDPKGLVAACRQHAPDVVMIEGDAVEWDVARVAGSVRRSAPKARVIAITRGAPSTIEVNRMHRCGMSAVIPRAGGLTPIVTAIENRTGSRHTSVTPGYPAASVAKPSLTTREATILNLVGAGFTSRAIAARLGISHKTVENHKQRIFAKLGVQSQAHAVSVALRAGMLDPEMVMGLAAAD